MPRQLARGSRPKTLHSKTMREVVAKIKHLEMRLRQKPKRSDVAMPRLSTIQPVNMPYTVINAPQPPYKLPAATSE